MISRLLGVRIKETPQYIEITGIRVHELYASIKKKWATTRIPKNIFRVLNSSSIKFSRFYAIEMTYILDELIKDTAYAPSARRRFKEIRAALVQESWLKDIDNNQKTLGFNFKKLDAFDRSKLTGGDLLPFQRSFLEAVNVDAPKLKLNGYLLDADPGTGKAQPLYSLVRTPTGWKRMGDMKVGDEVVAADGSVTRVLGVYPQGVRPCFEVTFSDGRSADCDINHLWSIDDHGVSSVMSMRQIIDHYRRPNPTPLHIPTLIPHAGVDIDLPVDPYLFGVLVGNGLYNQHLTVTIAEEKFFNAIQPLITRHGCRLVPTPNARYIYHVEPFETGINPLLVKVAAYNQTAATAEIPDIYLQGSLQQRLDILQGLMDMSGWYTHGGQGYYATDSEPLANAVIHLIRSVGGVASLHRHGGDKRWRVVLNHRTPSVLFRNAHGIREARAWDDVGDAARKLAITNIRRLPDQPTQCIEIAHPSHLYVTNNYVVTHNTITGVALALVAQATKTIVLAPRNVVKDVWVGTLNNFLKTPPKVWNSIDGDVDDIPADCDFYITHPQQLDKLIARADIFKRSKTVIIVDECHEYNELKSARTLNLIRLAELIKPFFILWSSGTPVKQLGRELIPLMITIDPLFDVKAQETFARIFGSNSTNGADIIANRMKRIRYKVVKSESVKIEVSTREVRVKLDNASDYTLDSVRKAMAAFILERFKYYQKEGPKLEAEYLRIVEQHRKKLFTRSELEEFNLYVSYVKAIRTKLDLKTQGEMIIFTNLYERDHIIPKLTNVDKRIFRNVKSVYKYLPLKIRGEALGRILNQIRIDCFMDIALAANLPEIIDNSIKKTLIFTSYVDVLKVVEDHLGDAGYRPATVHGETNKNLPAILKRIKSDPDYNPIIATYDSLSVGVPVTEANTVVLLNTPYRDYEYNQAVSRVNRYGQDTPVDIVKVVLDTGDEPNVSTRSDDIMTWSKTMVDNLMGIAPEVDNMATEAYVVDTLQDISEEELITHTPRPSAAMVF